MVKKAAIPLADAVRMASETPAKLIGIDSSKGTLQKGKSRRRFFCPHAKKESPAALVMLQGFSQDGDYLLSHLRSTIGVTKLNFSVRNGKRWNLRAIVT